MVIRIIKDKIDLEDLKEIAKNQFGDLVKAVVDVENEVMALGGELHADEEVFLNEEAGSKRENTWGINIYPGKFGDEMIEFDSMINIKPQYDNRSRGVEKQEIRERVIAIVKKLVIS